MFKKIINIYSNLEKKTFLILKYGLEFCFALLAFSVVILFTYEFVFTIPLIYHIGILLFKLSLTFSIEFLICAIVVDSLKKQLI